MNFDHRFCLALLLLALAIAAGCGKNGEKKLATQVAARVDSYEITVHQINGVLARSQNVAPETAARAKREILDKLIDQQLARQQAIEKKLHRSPGVMQTIEAAKSEILARSYFEQVAAAQPRPTAEEVKKYYSAHPELFAQRRIFNLEEIIVLPKEGLVAKLREQTVKARAMQDIAAWLKSQDAVFTENRGVRAAEQIPLDLLPKLQVMKDGEIRLIEAGSRLNVFRVVATQAAPVDETTATPRIQQFLFNQRLSEAIARDIAQLKQKARIKYLGEFADGAPATAVIPPAKAETAPPAQPPGADFDKGVRGLR